MLKKNDRINFKRFFAMATLFSALGLTTACSEIKTRQDTENLISKRDDFNRGDENPKAPITQTLKEQEPEQKKVALILGPGGYKTFAHAGVIKELKKKNIPIQAVVGLEWGALVAALYAQRGQINEAEWKLYKLEKLNLNSSGFFSRKKEIQSVHILDGYLRENLNVADISQTVVPFYCTSLSLQQGAMVWQDRGSLPQAVSNCLSYPPLFSNPQQQVVAGLFSFEEVVLRLKKEGFNVIILVNVLGDGNLFDNSVLKDDYSTAVLRNEVRRSIWRSRNLVTDTIDVSTRGIGITDFDSRKVLVTAGEAAGEKAAKVLSTKYGF